MHITIITRRRDRRLMGSVGARRNLCGGELTTFDVPYADAKKLIGTREMSTWVKCQKCILCLELGLDK